MLPRALSPGLGREKSPESLSGTTVALLPIKSVRSDNLPSRDRPHRPAPPTLGKMRFVGLRCRVCGEMRLKARADQELSSLTINSFIRNIFRINPFDSKILVSSHV